MLFLVILISLNTICALARDGALEQGDSQKLLQPSETSTGSAPAWPFHAGTPGFHWNKANPFKKKNDNQRKQEEKTTSSASSEELPPTTRLALVLFSTICTIFMGAGCKLFEMINHEKGHMHSIQFFVGKIAFPLLVFKTVATSDIGSIDLRVVLACALGKLCVLIGSWALAYFLYQSDRSKGQRILTSTVFSLYCTASNDFAIGFPVIGAMYGPSMSIYLSANALVQAAVFQPLIMIKFAVGKSIKASEDTQETVVGGGSTGSVCMRTAKEILFHPVIEATIVGLTLNIGMGIKTLPHPLSDVIDAFTAPFPTLALFMTGMALQAPKVNSWVCMLVIMKVFICAYLSYIFALLLGVLSTELEDFSFFYGMIPASSAPLVFAQTFDPTAVETVATSILLGIFTAAPNMIITSMFMAEPGDMIEALASTIIAIGWISFGAGVIFVFLLCVTIKHWAGLKEGIAVYGIIAFLYTSCLLCLSVFEWPCAAVLAGAKAYWCPYRMFFNILQKACVLSLLYLRYNAPLSDAVDWTRGFGASVIKQLAVASLAIIPAVLTHPSTLDEVCKMESEGKGLSQHLIVSIILLLLTVAMELEDLLCPATAPPAEGNNNAIQMASPADDVEAIQIDSEMPTTSDGRSHSRSGAFTIRTLFRLMGLRFLLQIVTSGSLCFGLSIRGSLTQMIIIECIFEHGQMLFLLLTLLFDPSFKNKILIAVSFRDKAHRLYRQYENFHAHYHFH